MELVINLGGFLLLLVAGYVVGRVLENRHFDSIRAREQATASMTVVPLQDVPGLGGASERAMVMGAVVVSIDYFKRFAGGLRNLFGGRVAGYETVMDRGRREALLRMKEQALAAGFDTVLCVRVETSRLASSLSNGNGTAGVEILAYGTAVRGPRSA